MREWRQVHVRLQYAAISINTSAARSSWRTRVGAFCMWNFRLRWGSVYVWCACVFVCMRDLQLVLWSIVFQYMRLKCHLFVQSFVCIRMLMLCARNYARQCARSYMYILYRIAKLQILLPLLWALLLWLFYVEGAQQFFWTHAKRKQSGAIGGMFTHQFVHRL